MRFVDTQSISHLSVTQVSVTMDDGDGGYGGRSMFPTGGQIILSALQNSNNNKSQHPSHESLTMDPAVAAVGPTLPQQPWMTSSSSYEHDLFLQSFRQAQNPWSSSSGNTNFPGNTSQRDDMWGSGFQNQMPEMRIGSFPLSSSSGDGLLNSNRVDNAAAASDLLSRLKGVNDYSFGVGDGNFVEPGRSRQFELQGSSSNSSVQRLGNYGNFEYERTGNGGLDRKDHGVVHRSPYDNELSRQGHGVVHRSSRDDGLSRQDHGVAHMSYRDDGLSRHDHGVVHRSSRDDGLSRQDHGVVHRSPGDGGLSRQVHRVVNRAGYSLYNEGLSRQDPLYDKGLSRQDYNAVHRSLNEGRSSSQDHGVVYSSSLEKRRTPPGFPSNPQEGRNLVGRNNRIFEQNVGIANDDFGESSNTSVTSIGNERGRNPSHANSRANAFQNSRVIEQFDRPGPPTGSNLHSVRASAIEGSLQDLHAEITNIANEQGYHKKAEIQSDVDGSIDKSDQKKAQNIREKYARSDTRGNWLLSQKMRNHKRLMLCRSDIGLLNAPLLAIYESLIPAAEEKAKQKQLFALLERLVSGEWPEAKLYLYGSCANSFDVSKSDIDVCLAIDDPEINKSDFLLRLAEILESNNLQNVQALTRARVPIVKLKDPVTGISCDICMNNVLAVVNTKLLRDYAEVDVRLRQLAFLVKHWAKSRGVNETYQGTLSSYAYVLMCIHFLQQRKPAVLPCLQEMEPTYSVTVNDVKCAYFDRVEKLYGYGSRNKESISQLLWGFFSYWAYGHDYANNAISVRTGSIISKQSKDWTTRVGNDRHLICIEDPFQTSHDLGRVVDKYSIKVVREEFERAAHIMQHDPNPCVKLFETYVPEREPLE